VVRATRYLDNFVILRHACDLLQFGRSELSESRISESKLALISKTARVKLIIFGKEK